MIRDKRRTVERHGHTIGSFRADSIGRNDRNHVGSGVTAHHDAPVLHRIERRRCGLRANRGRIHQKLCAAQHQTARRFWKPLVPADSDAQSAKFRLDRIEPRVSWREVVLLFVPGRLRNVALAVVSHRAAVGIEHDDGIEQCRSRPLENRYRNHDPDFARHAPQPLYCRMAVERPRQIHERVLLNGAKIRRLEQLLNQHHVRTCGGGLPDQALGLADILVNVPATGELRCCQRNLAHT